MHNPGKFIFILLILTCGERLQAQEILKRVEPAFWWIGMNEPTLQLLVQGESIGSSSVTINYPGVRVEKITQAESKNYLFIDLSIDKKAKAGNFNIEFQVAGKKKITYNYQLKEREKDKQAYQGIDQHDVIYLLMPDRFVNGNPANDETKSLKEKKNRTFHGGRHGGDLQGILSKVDYLNDLGVTTLWINPLVENDMPEYSYHGYAITDYYKTDARYGSNEEYKNLANELHKRKMKLIMDMVFNHCGREHWWMKDMPFADWVHYYPGYVNTNHAMASVSDPHGAESDRKQFEQGWFVEQMPDLNQDNTFLAKYLIQNSIWWIEYAGLDGIRMDTYPYNKKEFMNEWATRIYTEYPRFYLVGEAWVESEAQEAWWISNSQHGSNEFNSALKSVTDFPLCFATQRAFKKDGNMLEIYKVLSKDFLYQSPSNNKIFVDNHDMDRVFFSIGKDLTKFKLLMTFLLTTRGIPQVFSGTEILMSGNGEHGIIREDFPGGWSDDKRNAFTEQDRTLEENEAFNHIKKLLLWRKQSDAIQNGALKHFVPHDNVYVYNRRSDKESVMVIINNSTQTKKIDMSRFSEVWKDYPTATDVITNAEISNLKEIEVKGNSSLILKLNSVVKSE